MGQDLKTDRHFKHDESYNKRKCLYATFTPGVSLDINGKKIILRNVD